MAGRLTTAPKRPGSSTTSPLQACRLPYPPDEVVTPHRRHLTITRPAVPGFMTPPWNADRRSSGSGGGSSDIKSRTCRTFLFLVAAVIVLVVALVRAGC